MGLTAAFSPTPPGDIGFYYRGNGDRNPAWARLNAALSEHPAMQELLLETALFYSTQGGGDEYVLKLQCALCRDNGCLHRRSSFQALAHLMMQAPSVLQVLNHHGFGLREAP